MSILSLRTSTQWETGGFPSALISIYGPTFHFSFLFGGNPNLLTKICGLNYFLFDNLSFCYPALYWFFIPIFCIFICQNSVELNNLIHQSLLSERLSCSVRALESVVCKSWNNLSSKRINDNLKNLISTSVDLLRKRFLTWPWQINWTLSLLSDITEQWACIPKKQFTLPTAIDGILVLYMC